MLFEKNIETFFEWQPVGVVCFFLLPPAFPSLGGRQYRRGNKPGWFACFDWGGFMDKRRWW